MAIISRQENACLIFSGYPIYTSKVMIQVSRELQIPLVRHESIFAERLKRDSYATYFVPGFDQHCVKEGYRIMAENISKVILSNL